MEKHLGKKLKELRTAIRKTQLAVSVDTGIPPTRISKLEAGRLQPTETEINALARYYGSLELLRIWSTETQTHQTVIYLCERMGMAVPRRNTVAAHHFGIGMISRTKKAIDLIRSAPNDEAVRQEYFLLAGQELTMVAELALALKMLVCDIKT